MYADDAKIYQVRDVNEDNADGLQRDLTSLYLWCQEWQLRINGSKCSLLRLGWNAQAAGTYSIGQNVLATEDCVKDLGVWISGKLTFSEHCAKVSCNASKRIGLIYRAFSSRDIEFMRNMFITYVRPLLEYNCEIWSPLYLRDIDLIENIQRRFLKRISGISNFSYRERLEMCSLEPLELRRLKKDIVLVYKIMNGMIALDFDEFFRFAPDVGTRGNGRKLYPLIVRRNVVVNYFCNRVINVWNSLPREVVTAPTLNILKKRLNQMENLLVPFLRGRAFRNP